MMARFSKLAGRWISDYGMSMGISDVTPYDSLYQENEHKKNIAFVLVVHIGELLDMSKSTIIFQISHFHSGYNFFLFENQLPYFVNTSFIFDDSFNFYIHNIIEQNKHYKLLMIFYLNLNDFKRVSFSRHSYFCYTLIFNL